MPCRSEYIEPNAREIESKLVAQLLLYVISRRVGVELKETNMIALIEAAEAFYGDKEMCDVFTRELCTITREMDEDDANVVIYDGRNSKARKLADWVERHEAYDKKRLTEEAKKGAQLEVFYYDVSLAKDFPWEHKERLENTAENRAAISTAVYDAGYQVFFGRQKGTLNASSCIDSKRFRQR